MKTKNGNIRAPRAKSNKVANVVMTTKEGEKRTFASALDAIIQNVKEDTALADIAKKCEEMKAEYNNKIKYTASTIRAHIRYRVQIQGIKGYLKDYNLYLKDKDTHIRVRKQKEAVKEEVNNN